MAQAVILEVDFNSDEAIQEISKLRARLADLKAEQKDLRKEGKEGSQQFSENAVEIKLLNNEVRKYEKSIVDQNRILQANEGSIEQLRATLSTLTAQWNALSEEERENTEIGQNLQASIKATSDELKGLEGSVGDTRRNVGNYQEAIDSAAQGTTLFGGAIPTVVANLRTWTAAAKAFIATPLGLTIAAIAAGLQAVRTWFSRTAEGQEELNKITTRFNAFLGTFLDLISKVGASLFEAFTNPREALQSFADYFKTFIIDRVNAFVDGLGLAGQAISKFFQGDFTGAAEDAAASAKKLFVEANPIIAAGTDLIQKAAEEVREFSKEIANDQKAAEELANRRNELTRREIEALTERARIESALAEARLNAQDKDRFGAEERLRFAEQSRDLANELSSLDTELAKERFELKRLENSINDSTLEDLREQAQLEADLINVRKQGADRQRELLERIISTQNEIEANASSKAAEAKKKAQEEIAAQEEAAKVAAEGIKAEFENQIVALKNRYAEGLITRERYEEEIQDLNLASLLAQNEALKFYGQDTLKLEASISEQRIKIRESEARQKKEIQQGEAAGFRDSLGKIQSLFAEHTAAYQAIRATQAVIDTYSAANMALSTYPPPLGAIAASLAVVQGLINVDKIREQATKFEDGGLIEIGGRPHSQGGTKFFGEDGTTFEAERGEVLAVVNKRSAPMLKNLSSINEMGGGVSFFGGSRSHLRDGGLVSRGASSQVRERIESRTLQNELAQSIQKIQIITKVSDLEKVNSRKATISKFSELG